MTPHKLLGHSALRVALLLGPLLVLACSDTSTEAPTAPSSAQFFGTPQDFGPAIAAANRHTPALMAQAGVVGTGVGVNAAGQPVLKVFLTSSGVPGIPDRVDGIGVVREVTGMFMAQTDPTQRARPAPVGLSIGHPDVTAGTLGARVTDGTSVYILSNNHVIANENDASLGDPTLQPGAVDGGTEPGDIIGTLHDFEPLSFNGGTNTMDAAITIVAADAVSGATPADDGYGAPATGTATPALGAPVQKYGRTTSLTKGQISELSVTVAVCYQAQGPFRCKKAATFTGQFAVTDGDFSDGGDSGSLIVTDDATRNPVGLLFAGSSTRTIASPIGPILTRFGVTIDPTVPAGDPNPAASFTYSCTNLDCDFTDTSTPGDGIIDTWSWAFGDGAVSTAPNPSHTYASGGDYTVTLTVTDDNEADDSDVQDVTVSEASGDLTLTATGHKVKGLQKADLDWSNASSTDVDVKRDGSVIATTPNDDSYTDNIDQRGGGSYTYQICEAGTETCSNEATVTF